VPINGRDILSKIQYYVVIATIMLCYRYTQRSTYVCPRNIWSTNAFGTPDFLISAYSANQTSVNVKIIHRYKHHPAESGIWWRTKRGKNEQLREPGRISSGRRKKLIVWSLSNASSPLLFPRESLHSPLEIFCHCRRHPARSAAARKTFSNVALANT